MNSYKTKDSVPKYNRGEFMFMFDPVTDVLTGVYDSRDSYIYTLKHPSFISAFGLAVESLDNEALQDLAERLKKEPKFSIVIKKLLESRKG